MAAARRESGVFSAVRDGRVVFSFGSVECRVGRWRLRLSGIFHGGREVAGRRIFFFYFWGGGFRLKNEKCGRRPHTKTEFSPPPPKIKESVSHRRRKKLMPNRLLFRQRKRSAVCSSKIKEPVSPAAEKNPAKPSSLSPKERVYSSFHKDKRICKPSPKKTHAEPLNPRLSRFFDYFRIKPRGFFTDRTYSTVSRVS